LVNHSLFLMTTLATLATGPAAFSQSTRPSLWQSSVFNYTRAERLDVSESTPTSDQINFFARPRQLRGQSSYGIDEVSAKPVSLGPVNIVRLAFRDSSGDTVPTLLSTPKDTAGPWPLVIAVHGLHSNKAQVCGQLASSLAKQGFAVLAADMPLHGERPGSPSELFAKKDWLRAIDLHRQGILDIRQCIDLAETRKDLDLSKGVVLAGYSMGSWLSSVAGPADERVAAMVLMVGGATEAAAFTAMMPALAAADPTRAIPHFAGRPLLLLNGSHDTTVTPEMAKRLIAAAPEPKEDRWYDSGHRLPESAYNDAAIWIQKTWSHLPPATD
jgi:fermentation-respiration switch protein FrsA (DUF1100 family)